MARRRNRGPYKFTARRRYALKKAQEKAARKKKIGKIAGAVGATIAVGATAYLGHRYGSKAIQSSVKNKRIKAYGQHREAVRHVSWQAKESNRIGNAVSVAHPSQTTTIGWYQKAQAEKIRKQLNRAKPAPAHMRGVTDRQTEKSVRRTLKENKVKVTGQKTGSLKGTPGGTKTYSKANPANTWSEDDHAAAQAFDTPHKPIVVPGLKTRTIPRDPMRALYGMKVEDEKLLGRD